MRIWDEVDVICLLETMQKTGIDLIDAARTTQLHGPRQFVF